MFGKIKERKGQMRDLWEEQNVDCHSTFALNILKGTVQPSATEAHTVAMR